MSSRGQILYTQHTVAFPSLGRHGRELDDLNVSISGRNGSIKFAWIELGGGDYPSGALLVEAFSDSLGVLLDPRIRFVLGRIRKRRKQDRDLPPATLIELLEEEDAIPSHYHVRGLLDSPGMTEPAARARLQERYELAKSYE